ncbi:hypothetical protein [Sphingosinithalassobacter sp. LHW66-3]|uniref:hypothetical protein n=1 Tax=Sphingosinithalassobacter sp. LHW66-3 TaxID=3424718 RepID=UPI003D6A4C0A
MTELLADLPEAFLFTAQRAGAGHHGLGRLQWRLGLPDGPPVATGTDVAHVEDGPIRSLHVISPEPPLLLSLRMIRVSGRGSKGGLGK